MLDNTGPSSCLSLVWEGSSLSIGYSDVGTGSPLLYLHGWGETRSVFSPLMEEVYPTGRHIALDFPGFGDSTPPPAAWGTVEYAQLVHEFVQHIGLSECTIIGHSFGGRIAFRLAAQWPEVYRRLILIASAGLRSTPPLRKRMRIKTIRTLAQCAQKCIPGRWGKQIKESLYHKIASRDYLQAGALRATFVRVVNDDLQEVLPTIQQPVTLIYGSDDRETPPVLGHRIADLLPNADYVELPGFDHYSILTRGKHQVGHQIRRLLNHKE